MNNHRKITLKRSYFSNLIDSSRQNSLPRCLASVCGSHSLAACLEYKCRSVKHHCWLFVCQEYIPPTRHTLALSFSRVVYLASSLQRDRSSWSASFTNSTAYSTDELKVNTTTHYGHTLHASLLTRTQSTRCPFATITPHFQHHSGLTDV